MPKDFLLLLRTKEPGAQVDFVALLGARQITFSSLYCQYGRAEQSGQDFIENLYQLEADFCSLSNLKQTIETTIPYDALLLFEFISW